MSIFDLLKKSPSGVARHIPEAGKDAAVASNSSPHRGEVARRSRVGEGEFQAGTCAIWNDIQRALESK
ncbi:hypothetical protein [Devosia sp.]|uniref:hypothetical protein n=1 Tax=Devosia sp. TaxID=1871048 RepID=UPI001ACED138|nr:hypothetical protein [Devosia sp.]MBN9333597.1 hypothetical protein [Devosia sp.]